MYTDDVSRADGSQPIRRRLLARLAARHDAAQLADAVFIGQRLIHVQPILPGDEHDVVDDGAGLECCQRMRQHRSSGQEQEMLIDRPAHARAGPGCDNQRSNVHAIPR